MRLGELTVLENKRSWLNLPESRLQLLNSLYISVLGATEAIIHFPVT